MKVLFGALALVLTQSAMADEFNRDSSPELLNKNYEAMHHMEMPYEVGRSTLTVAVDCQATKADAEKAINDKLDTLEALIDGVATRINLGEQTEYWGTKLDATINTNASDPMSHRFHVDKNQYFWTNRCTGATSATPVRTQNVFTGSVTISVWFPNEEQHLNHLTALITKLEAESESRTDGVRVTCQSNSGTNFDLDVTESTAKAAWAEIEQVAKERAQAKVRSDFSSTQYNNVWEGREYFTRGGQTQLPRLTVVKENGVWVAKSSNHKNFTVFYKQSSEPNSDAGLLSDKKTYSVLAEAKTHDGLYGTLTIAVRKQCMASKADAEADVAKVGNTILAELRKINGGVSTETDRLEIKDAFGFEYGPLRSYKQILDKRTVNYFYNPCTLDTYEVTEQPNIKAWEGRQVLTISSSDLDALVKLRDELDAKYTVDIQDPNQLAVSTSWNATAKLSVLEQMAGELETQASQMFLARGSEFQCDASNFSFACLADGEAGAGQHKFMRSAGAPQLESAAAYSDGVRSDVDASERGVKSFTGKYTISFTVRKVLINHQR